MALVNQPQLEQELIEQWLREKCSSFNSKHVRKSGSKTRRLQRKMKNDLKINQIASQVVNFKISLEECKKSMKTKENLEAQLQNAKNRIRELEENQAKIPTKVILKLDNTATSQKRLEIDHLMKFVEDAMRILEIKKSERANLPHQLELLKLNLEQKIKKYKDLCAFMVRIMQKGPSSRDVSKPETPQKSEASLPTPPSPASSVTPPVSNKTPPSPSSSILEHLEIIPTPSSNAPVASTRDDDMKLKAVKVRGSSPQKHPCPSRSQEGTKEANVIKKARKVIVKPKLQPHGEDIGRRLVGRGRKSVGGKYYCICGVLFCVKSDLEHHINMTTEERKFRCEICHRQFQFKVNLRSHKSMCQLG